MASAEAIADVVAAMGATGSTLADATSAEFYAELAIDSHHTSAWADAIYDRAMAFYALHNVFMDGLTESGAAGPIMSKRVGKTSVSYMPYSMSQGSKALTVQDADLDKSPWGRRYLALRQQQTGSRLVSGRIR